MLHVTPSKINLPNKKTKVHVTTRIRSSIITQLKSLLISTTREGTSRSLPLLSRSLSQPLCVPLEWAVLSQPCACCLTWEQLLRAIPDLCFRKGCSIARNSLTSTCSQVTAVPPTAICLLTGNKSRDGRDGSDCWFLTAPGLPWLCTANSQLVPFHMEMVQQKGTCTVQGKHFQNHFMGVLFEALPRIPPGKE